MEMGLDQVAIGEFKCGRPNNSADHLFRRTEIVLVMRTLSSAIRNDKRGLTRAPSPTGALCVICRRWRHVAHIHRIERGNIDAKLHRRRAEQGREENVWLARQAQLFPILLEFLAVLFTPAEAPLAPFSPFRINLCRMLAAFQTE